MYKNRFNRFALGLLELSQMRKKTLENIKHTCGHYDSFFIQVRCHHFITLGEAVQNGSKSTNLYGAEKYLQTVRK